MGLCSQPSAPDPNPGLIASAQSNEKIAQQQIDLGREQFQWSKDQAAQDRTDLMPIFQQQLRIGDQQEARSADQYDYWKTTYVPLEQKIVNDALQFNQKAEQERMAGQAGADVEQAYGLQREQNAREMARYGINPNSSTALSAMAQSGNDEALAKAGSMNTSRLQSRAMGMAMMADAANMGRGLSGQSNSAAQVALQAGQAGQGNVMGQTGMQTQTRGLANANYGMAVNANNSAGNIYSSDFSSRMQGYGTAMQGYGANMSLLGSVLGGGMGMAAAKGFADGGPPSVGSLPAVANARKAGLVRGPGGPIDDAIDAKLSNGEYVIPADVVRKKGEEFFDKIVQKHHVPAEAQRSRGL